MKLVFAQDDDAACGLVGGLKGLLKPETALAELDPEALVAEFAGQDQGGGVETFAQRGDERVGHLRWGSPLVELVQEGKDEPVFAHGKADAGRLGSADGFA